MLKANSSERMRSKGPIEGPAKSSVELKTVISMTDARFVAALNMAKKENSQTQGRLPPHPRQEDSDSCAGGKDLLRAKPALTLAMPLVSPPNFPHFLGKARPLVEGQLDAWRYRRLSIALSDS